MCSTCLCRDVDISTGQLACHHKYQGMLPWERLSARARAGRVHLSVVCVFPVWSGHAHARPDHSYSLLLLLLVLTLVLPAPYFSFFFSLLFFYFEIPNGHIGLFCMWAFFFEVANIVFFFFHVSFCHVKRGNRAGSSRNEFDYSRRGTQTSFPLLDYRSCENFGLAHFQFSC